jgi:hypothetical protein
METWQYGNSLINYMKLVRILIEKLGYNCKVVFALFVTDITSGWNFKKYCAANSDSAEVELRFCPWLILFKY